MVALGVTNPASFTVTVLSAATAPPVFGGYSVPAPGQFGLQATGTAGLTYTLQTSTNLVDWVTCTNVLADSGGLVQCLDAMGTNTRACFYRVSRP